MKIIAKHSSRTLYNKINDVAKKIVVEDDPEIREDLYQEMMRYVMRYRRIMYTTEKFIASFDVSTTEKEWD